MILPFGRFIIQGHSMVPTLEPGAEVLVFSWAYLFGGPQAGDLVAVTYGGEVLIKRVREVYRHKVFLLGDNPLDSQDSKSFGWVAKSAILGKAYPL